jgi:myo-inositol-1-phosphate synthase
VGNCFSSLLQGINHYGQTSANGANGSADVGLMHRKIGPYEPQDIKVVAAFDIDRRKVGLDAAEAIFAPPNCTKVFSKNIEPTGAIVMMGCVFDGCADHMKEYDAARTFLPLEKESTREQIIEALRKSGAEIMVNYLPVGSEEATRFYSASLTTSLSSSRAIRSGQNVLPTRHCRSWATTSKRSWARQFCIALSLIYSGNGA